MKNFLLMTVFLITLAACKNSGGKGGGSDTTTAPSDTTNLHVNPALEDPNSNMADTMQVKDSLRVRDTSTKDNTAVKPKKH